MQIKFNYTSGGEFTSNGNDYVGFFNVDDGGSVRTQKYQTTSSLILTPISKYSSDFYKSPAFKDREASADARVLTKISKYASDYYASTTFKDRDVFVDEKLPYEISEILVKGTEIVNYQIINKRLGYFQKNLQYLYSRMFFGNTDIPSNSVYCLTGDNAGNFTWSDYDSLNQSTSSINMTDLSGGAFYGIKKFVVTTFDDNESGYCILGITDTSLIGLSTNSNINSAPESMTLVLSTDVIDNYSNQKCLNLEDIKFDGRFIFVTDSQINGGGQVFKYDISSYITNDEIYEFNRFLVEQIGGAGTETRTDKFSGCSVLGVNEASVWVYDSGNKAIKIYDTNFVWKRSVVIPSKAQTTVLDIAYRKLNDHFYVLYKNTVTNKFGMWEYNSNYNVVDTVVFEDVLYQDTDKEFKRMVISEQDSNVFYLITDQNIHKKFFSKPKLSFAVFDNTKYMPSNKTLAMDDDGNEVGVILRNKIIGSNIRDIVCIGDDFNSDKLFVLGNGFFSKLIEKTDYITVFSNPDIKYFNIESVNVQSHEYVQALTFNKEIYKLIVNCLEFRNHLIGRLLFNYNDNGDLLNTSYGYISQEYFKRIDEDYLYTSFVHDNELIQSGVINRIFRSIYKLQLDLLEQTKASILNIKSVPNLDNALYID